MILDILPPNYVKIRIFQQKHLEILRVKNKFYSIFCFHLTPKEPLDPREHNLNFDKLCKLKKWSNRAEILVCGGLPSYLSILTQNKFKVSEL